MKVSLLLSVAAVALLHGTYGALLIRGPNRTLLENELVKVECWNSEPGFNFSDVYFESRKLSAYDSMLEAPWRRVWDYRWSRSFRCMSGIQSFMEVDRFNDTIALTFVTRSMHQNMEFRCVSMNRTMGNEYSPTQKIKVSYIHTPWVTTASSRDIYNKGLKVQTGDNVTVTCSARSSETPLYVWQKQGSEWILPSSKMTLKNVTVADSGLYNCMAKSSSKESLNANTTVQITVLPDDDFPLLVPTVLAATLLVVVLAASVLLFFKLKQMRTIKGPIGDRSLTKPMYTGSVETLAVGEKWILV